MENELSRSRFIKGKFMLYDKLTNTVSKGDTWTFLYNPEEIIDEINAKVSNISFAGQNWSTHHVGGIESEVIRMTLSLTGDNLQQKTIEEPEVQMFPETDTMVGEVVMTITPSTSSQVGVNATEVQNIFSEYGAKNMVYHIEHLKSLMLKDPNHDWRLLFDYGNIVKGVGIPNVFILKSLRIIHKLCSADLNATILATVEVELIVDSTRTITRTQHLQTFKNRQVINEKFGTKL